LTRSAALAGLGLRIGRWLLPWIAVFIVSATLVYAINAAIAGRSLAGDQRRDVQVAVLTGEATGDAAVDQLPTWSSAQSADPSAVVTPERCAPIRSPYVDSSVAESRKIDCGWAP
jgi:hypothetical protein